MNSELRELFSSIRTYEQKMHLGDCSDGNRRGFIRFLMSMPLEKADFNYKILANRGPPRTTSFVSSTIADYKAWLRDECAKKNKDNRAIYDKATTFIYGG